MEGCCQVRRGAPGSQPPRARGPRTQTASVLELPMHCSGLASAPERASHGDSSGTDGCWLQARMFLVQTLCLRSQQFNLFILLEPGLIGEMQRPLCLKGRPWRQQPKDERGVKTHPTRQTSILGRTNQITQIQPRLQMIITNPWVVGLQRKLIESNRKVYENCWKIYLLKIHIVKH